MCLVIVALLLKITSPRVALVDIAQLSNVDHVRDGLYLCLKEPARVQLFELTALVAVFSAAQNGARMVCPVLACLGCVGRYFCSTHLMNSLACCRRGLNSRRRFFATLKFVTMSPSRGASRLLQPLHTADLVLRRVPPCSRVTVTNWVPVLSFLSFHVYVLLFSL